LVKETAPVRLLQVMAQRVPVQGQLALALARVAELVAQAARLVQVALPVQVRVQWLPAVQVRPDRESTSRRASF
jgi:hypothetical protein